MRNRFSWILFLILPYVLVTSRPLDSLHNGNFEPTNREYEYNAKNVPKSEDNSQSEDPQVISVRITSSVAIGRSNGNTNKTPDIIKISTTESLSVMETPTTESSDAGTTTIDGEKLISDLPPDLTGANIEFIKQLNAKKGARGLHNIEQIHPFQLAIQSQQSNETDDSVAEPSIKSIIKITDNDDKINSNIDNIPLGRSVALSPTPKNYIQGLTQKPLSERGNSLRLTTVSFNIVHDTTKVDTNYEPSNTYSNPSQTFSRAQQYYNEPAKVYSQPAQVYSEPAQVYSEPAKFYSEPAKIYSEPAKIYGEPAKIYSEPAKFYSEPASLHLTPNVRNPWNQQSNPPASSTINTTPITAIITNPTVTPDTRQNVDHQPERNYEVDEKVSVMTDGKSHGVQESGNENCKQDKCKVGYVVEGRQYRKYRVEERTPDGFIVGEYGVVRNEDGALRGVRYTADGEASPRLIYDALMKFLQLK